MQEVHVKRSIPPILILLGLAAGCASSDEAVTRSALQTPPPAANEVQRTTTSMTVGEVLAKGGRQLSPTEVKSLLTNAVMEGGTATAWREMSFPDGKVTGQSRMGDGLVIDYQGSWWMDEQGRRCWLNDHQRLGIRRVGQERPGRRAADQQAAGRRSEARVLTDRPRKKARRLQARLLAPAAAAGD
jgi:hypothetical protein